MEKKIPLWQKMLFAGLMAVALIVSFFFVVLQTVLDATQTVINAAVHSFEKPKITHKSEPPEL